MKSVKNGSAKGDATEQHPYNLEQDTHIDAVEIHATLEPDYVSLIRAM